MLILMMLEGTGDVLLLWVCFVWIWWGSSVLVVPIWIDPGRGNAIHHKLGWIGMGLKFIHLPLQFIQLVPAMKCCRKYHMIFLQFLEGFGGLCGPPPWWSQKSYKMNTFTNRLLKGKIWRWFSNSKMLIVQGPGFFCPVTLVLNGQDAADAPKRFQAEVDQCGLVLR